MRRKNQYDLKVNAVALLRLLSTFGMMLLAYVFGEVCARLLVPLIPVPEWAGFLAFLVLTVCTGGAFLAAGLYLLDRRGLF